MGCGCNKNKNAASRQARMGGSTQRVAPVQGGAQPRSIVSNNIKPLGISPASLPSPTGRPAVSEEDRKARQKLREDARRKALGR